MSTNIISMAFPDRAPIPKNTRQHHVELIGAAWQKGVESIIGTGRLLLAAKDALEHGEFAVMIENELPFTQNTAERLMAIARNPVISNSAHVQSLPPSWGTLYELTRLSPAVLERKIKSGAITPKLERKEVVAMRTVKKATKSASPKASAATVTALAESVQRERRTEEHLQPDADDDDGLPPALSLSRWPSIPDSIREVAAEFAGKSPRTKIKRVVMLMQSLNVYNDIMQRAVAEFIKQLDSTAKG